MKYVLRYETSPDLDMEAVVAHFPAHQARWQEYQEAGTLLAIGPMADPRDGAMAVFTSRQAAEAFAVDDPFVTEGLVTSHTILEWNEVLLDSPDD